MDINALTCLFVNLKGTETVIFRMNGPEERKVEPSGPARRTNYDEEFVVLKMDEI